MPTDTQTFTALFSNASLVVAFFGGMVMLFAPCCITLMLPAYLGSVFKAKNLVILMTLVFALGVATIMLPLVLGARFIASFFSHYHFLVFALGSLLMIAIGIMSLLGKTIKVPFVNRLRAPQVTNLASAYSLGLVSGITSTCCAPVLFGALSLSVVSTSFAQALGVGLAYTFGIVTPLFIFGLFYERGLWKWAQKLQRKTLTIAGYQALLSNFVSFIIFTLTGTAFLVLAFFNRLGMNAQSAQIATNFKYFVDTTTKPLRAIPYFEPIFGLLLLGFFIWLVKLSFQPKHNDQVENTVETELR